MLAETRSLRLAEQVEMKEVELEVQQVLSAGTEEARR